MGVNGLWKLVSPYAQRRSLRAYCAEILATAPSSNSLYHYLRIGVDMSTVMSECENAAAASERHGYFEGGAIYILFTKLAVLLLSPATFIFVLDGPARPTIKRHHRVLSDREKKWIPAARELIAAFGYHIHQAPGEAEAELAMLNCHGVINAIMTSDSDILVFGGKTILRTVQNAAKEIEDDTDIILESTLFDPEGPGLTHYELIFFALVTGGDYDPIGIPGCGPTTARALARCGFATRLAECYQHATDDPESYRSLLQQWRRDIQQELTTNSQGYLPRRDPSTALAIPMDFPSHDIIKLYFNPVVTSVAHALNLSWLHHQPSLPRIAQFCASKFRWESQVIIVKRFQSMLFEGVVHQAFFSPLAAYDRLKKRLFLPDLQIDVVSLSWRRRRGKYAKKLGDAPLPRIVCKVDSLIQGISAAYTVSGAHVSISSPLHLLPPAVQTVLQSTRPSSNAQITTIPDLEPSGEIKAMTSKSASSRPLRHLGVLELTDSEDEPVPVPSSSRFDGNYIDLTLSD